jgi:hypothetical protein
VAIEAVAAAVVAPGGTGVGVAHGVLHVAERHASVESSGFQQMSRLRIGSAVVDAVRGGGVADGDGDGDVGDLGL